MLILHVCQLMHTHLTYTSIDGDCGNEGGGGGGGGRRRSPLESVDGEGICVVHVC